MQYNLKTTDQLRPLLVGFHKAAGLSQAELAASLNIRQQSYAKLEASPEKISIERLIQVLRLLKVELVFNDDAETASPDDSCFDKAAPSADIEREISAIQVDDLASKSRKEEW